MILLKKSLVIFHRIYNKREKSSIQGERFFLPDVCQLRSRLKKKIVKILKSLCERVECSFENPAENFSFKVRKKII